MHHLETFHDCNDNIKNVNRNEHGIIFNFSDTSALISYVCAIFTSDFSLFFNTDT